MIFLVYFNELNGYRYTLPITDRQYLQITYPVTIWIDNISEDTILNLKFVKAHKKA
jgi:hypothetical protein